MRRRSTSEASSIFFSAVAMTSIYSSNIKFKCKNTHKIFCNENHSVANPGLANRAHLKIALLAPKTHWLFSHDQEKVECVLRVVHSNVILLCD